MQQSSFNENAKIRLTDGGDIRNAIRIFRMHGFDNDQLVVEITKLFYLDLDAFNDIVALAPETSEAA